MVEHRWHQFCLSLVDTQRKR